MTYCSVEAVRRQWILNVLRKLVVCKLSGDGRAVALHGLVNRTLGLIDGVDVNAMPARITDCRVQLTIDANLEDGLQLVLKSTSEKCLIKPAPGNKPVRR